MNALILVTGAAGFIGSFLVERLLKIGEQVRGFDNLSTGKMENLTRALKHTGFEFVQGDCLKPSDVRKALCEVEHVFHLAADAEVRKGVSLSDLQFRRNVLATRVLLEQIRKSRSLDSFVLVSSSTVYGNATEVPTPESYGPLCPISAYGATKLACEALSSSYAHILGFRAIILRLANIVGLRSWHSALNDFVNKIKANPSSLPILGDGTQSKSYLHISDCIDAIIVSWKKTEKSVVVLNVGSKDCISVANVADLVIREMNTRSKVEFVGGTCAGAGWPGDVKNMWLDISRLEKLGWTPTMNSAESVTLATREFLGKTLLRS